MGSIRFTLASPDRLAVDYAERIAFLGLEDIPLACRVFLDEEDGLLVVEAPEDQSGAIHLPWIVDGHGELMLSTATLMQRGRPYQLEVELARGAVNRLRGQVAAWQGLGLVVPPEIASRISSARHNFVMAATHQDNEPLAARHGEMAIAEAVELTIALGLSYTEQAIGVRRRHTPRIPALLGVHLGSRPVRPEIGGQLASTFNSAQVPLAWRGIEAQEGSRDWDLAEAQLAWCEQHNLKVFGGPLIDMYQAALPDWLSAWQDDFDTLLSFLVDHVRTVVNRYRNRVHLWIVSGNTSGGPLLNLNEDQRMRMIIRAIEITRELDPRSPTVVCFDQPWGEPVLQERNLVPAINLADALIRSGLGVAGLALRIDAGYYPGGTARRTMLDYSRMLDRWSMLGMPLMVRISTASSPGKDPLARPQVGVLSGDGPRSVSPESQAAWLRQYGSLMLAKNCVQAIVWNQLEDSQPHDFPSGGLFAADGAAKLVVEELATIRRGYLA